MDGRPREFFVAWLCGPGRVESSRVMGPKEGDEEGEDEEEDEDDEEEIPPLP